MILRLEWAQDLFRLLLKYKFLFHPSRSDVLVGEGKGTQESSFLTSIPSDSDSPRAHCKNKIVCFLWLDFWFLTFKLYLFNDVGIYFNLKVKSLP